MHVRSLPESSSSTLFLFSDAPSDLSSPALGVSLLLFYFSYQHLPGLSPPGPYKGTIKMRNDSSSHHSIHPLHE